MNFHVDTGSPQPIYLQLVQQVRQAVARGELRADEQLPSVRALATELTVNPNTVARAYTELERDGTLVSRPGLGIFVARSRPELSRAARQRRLAELLDHWLTEAVHLGFCADEVLHLVAARVKQFHWNPDQAE
jgi:GntR family transcriptional regulator